MNDSAIDALLSRCRFPEPATPVTCAVSGGADSTALLVLGVRAGLKVTAVHVDHGLRPGSELESQAVAELAGRYGASFVAERVVVEQGPNLEARARAARYAVLPADVLTGHTADDQAETVLVNLMRGAALAGVAGMGSSRRPLLGLRRFETIEVCRLAGIEPIVDPSNADPAFLRNRVRGELLPLLNELADRDVVPVLARQARLARDDVELLGELAGALEPTDARALTAAARPLARRAVRDWLQAATGADHPPDAATIERVLDVAAGSATATDIGRGWRVSRSEQRLAADPPS